MAARMVTRKYRVMGNLIIKNEESNMREIITNMAPYCDAITILDTGSDESDRGVMIAKETLDELKIPGRIRCVTMPTGSKFHFGTARTAALKFAGEVIEEFKDPVSFPQGPLFPQEWEYYKKFNNNWYIFVMDADNRITEEKERAFICRDSLGTDQYSCTMIRGSHFKYTVLTKYDLDGFKKWSWKDARHEYVSTVGEWKPTSGTLEFGHISSRSAGARSRDPMTYHDDLIVFKRDMIRDPYSTRYVFYAARSAEDCNELQTAFELYVKRAGMNHGWREEQYYSLICAAKLHRKLHPEEPQDANKMYLQAIEMSDRLEAPYQLILYYDEMKYYKSAWLLAKGNLGKAYPKDGLFVDAELYKWRFDWQASLVAYWAGDKPAYRELTRKVLGCASIPNHIRERAEKNLVSFG